LGGENEELLKNKNGYTCPKIKQKQTGGRKTNLPRGMDGKGRETVNAPKLERVGKPHGVIKKKEGNTIKDRTHRLCFKTRFTWRKRKANKRRKARSPNSKRDKGNTS